MVEDLQHYLSGQIYRQAAGLADQIRLWNRKDGVPEALSKSKKGLGFDGGTSCCILPVLEYVQALRDGTDFEKGSGLVHNVCAASFPFVENRNRVFITAVRT